MSSDHHIVYVAFDGVQTLDLTGPHDVFGGANAVLDDRSGVDRRYVQHVISVQGGVITSESGLRLVSDTVEVLPAAIDTLVIPGGVGTRDASTDPATVELVGALGRRSARTLTVCSGAFIGAAAGLLDGCRVTTHWARSAALARRFEAVAVDDEPIYIRDGHVWSSAGVTAGIDLALAVVEHDHGAETAQIVARWLVMFLRRPGGQSQFATPVWTERADLEPVRLAQDLIDLDPGGDHRVALLAERVGMSERHFARRFAEQVGLSPAQYVASVRLEAARRALETTDDTIDAIANSCGFGTSETMRRTFSRRLSTTPDQYRRRFRHHPERIPS